MHSDELFARAQVHIPGGVNSPVRAFNGVGGTPVFFESAQGAHLYDVDGKAYIDYVGSWGPMIAGHSHPDILAAVQTAASNGLSFGAPAPAEVTMADKICALVPAMDMVRMVNSGTEATMSALRLARAATKRDRFIKFEGCYHGHADSFLVKAGSGALTLGVPTSPGVPKVLADLTITLPYNDEAAIREFMAAEGDTIAAIIVEPVAGNMNCIPPQAGYLQALREVCDKHGSLLIFDEVMTGFRVALGGAQERFGIVPDLSTFGKVIGAGMPVGAFGGKKEFMQMIAPSGPVYQAGTLSGNPVAMAAGLANLEIICEPGFYTELENKTTRLLEGLQAAADAAGIAFTTTQVGGMFGLFFTDQKNVSNFEQATNCDLERFKKFYHCMLDKGVYLAPSAYEAGFMSQAHTNELIDQTIAIAASCFKEL